ncbi:MAG: hypothetical protein WCW36_01200 [Candidatus Paceibacterota bacterium]|jgi:hypothetical protein
MNDMQMGILLMFGSVTLIGITVGFYTSKHGDIGRGFTFGNDDESSEEDWLKAIMLYVITAFIYIVGILTFQPAAMTNPYYSPWIYAPGVICCGFVMLIIAISVFAGIFDEIKKWARWYVTISNK